MKKIFLAFILLSFIFIGLLYHTLTLGGTVFSPPPLTGNKSLIVLPLDSRPPCSDFPRQLGALAGFEIVSPPTSLMDQREKPAQTKLLKAWLTQELPTTQGAIISTDLLGFGGLWQNRLAPLPVAKRQELLNYLKNLRQTNPQQAFYVYSIIPRLLVSDQIVPDCWYQWHLMQWSISMDKKMQGLAYDKKQYQELQQEIPMELKVKYTKLFTENALWNKELTRLAQENDFSFLTIGQDDAMLFGLPNYNRQAAAKNFTTLNCPSSFKVTQGADEIGALALGVLYLQQEHIQPKIYVDYTTSQTKDLILHFVPLTLEKIVEDKLALLGAQAVQNPQEADFIFFVHCGEDDQKSYASTAKKLKEYMLSKPVALVDLSKNFVAREALLPALLAMDVPLPKLLAYAGWNTASNSIGTALAQASIVYAQGQKLPQDKLPSLYAQNATFTLARLLDDWAYQKKIRSNIKDLEDLNGVAANNTRPHTALVANYIARELYFYKQLLLYGSYRRHSFFQQGKTAYYLKDFDYSVELPWDRYFEIKLILHPTFVKKEI